MSVIPNMLKDQQKTFNVKYSYRILGTTIGSQQPKLLLLNQGSFDHVKVEPTPVLSFHNL